MEKTVLEKNFFQEQKKQDMRQLQSRLRKLRLPDNQLANLERRKNQRKKTYLAEAEDWLEPLKKEGLIWT